MALADEKLNQIKDSEGDLLGWWVPLTANATTNVADDPENVTRTRNASNREVREVLVVNDDYNVTGSYLQNVRAGHYAMQGPTIDFSFNSQGAIRFGELTGHNLPDEVQGHKRKLGIILDGALMKPPTSRARSPIAARSQADT